jgi:ABC-type branched-subunit amino acid transport system substrate-binding protein
MPTGSPPRTWVARLPEHRRARQLALVGVAVLVGATFLAPGTSAGAPPALPPDQPLRVGGVVDAELYGGATLGAQARFAAVNAAGGVHGRPIEIVGVTDDHRSPPEHAAALRHLLGDEHVDAVVPLVSGAFAGVPDLERSRVPAFGWGISGAYCGSTWVFAITGCLTPLLPRRAPGIWGVAIQRLLHARDSGSTAAVVADDGGADRAVAEVSAVARAAGLRLVYARARLSAGGPAGTDVGAIARAVLRADRGKPPAVVFTVSSFANVAALQATLRAQGYTGITTNLVQYAPFLAGPAAGADVLTQFATPESAPQNPAMQRIVEEIAAVTSGPITPAMLAGWFAADFFVKAATRAGAGATAADIRRVARRSTYQVPKTIGPTRFPDAFTIATSCGQLVSGDGTGYTVAVPFGCSPTVALSPK